MEYADDAVVEGVHLPAHLAELFHGLADVFLRPFGAESLEFLFGGAQAVHPFAQGQQGYVGRILPAEVFQQVVQGIRFFGIAAVQYGLAVARQQDLQAIGGVPVCFEGQAEGGFHRVGKAPESRVPILVRLHNLLRVGAFLQRKQQLVGRLVQGKQACEQLGNAQVGRSVLGNFCE